MSQIKTEQGELNPFSIKLYTDEKYLEVMKPSDKIKDNTLSEDEIIKLHTTPINNFEEYGFTADFEGEILKEVESSYIGWVRAKHGVISMNWFKRGLPYCCNENFPLAPIKKEWYEYKSNVGKLFYADMFDYQILATFQNFCDGWIVGKTLKGEIFEQKSYKCRLATKVERDSLFCKED